ncbi:DUF6763 family protein [Microbulbifer yueqingensis]|uniref:Uncharacterized protein n=1 Tax=Microbulbifer yueqingensis TaxID=658219 RepID=A0A1G9A703_9GAMM|nr:DUF6763 family protein [Microbulbifer yueqingensis]SDK23068.1 hypothetical protein SAMN05216212_1876 [Microbulbifer yueqingensis]
MANSHPDIGNWFEMIESGQLFEVVAIDDLHKTVEIQYLDGMLDELDLEQWLTLPLVPAAPPEDANVAYGMTAREHSPASSETPLPEQLNPLDSLEGETFSGTDESL